MLYAVSSSMIDTPIGKLAYMDTVGKRIKKAMDDRGLTAPKLGGICLVSRQTVSMWINDKTVPTGENFVKVAEATGTDLRYLITGDEPSKADAIIAQIKTSLIGMPTGAIESALESIKLQLQVFTQMGGEKEPSNPEKSSLARQNAQGIGQDK